VTSGEEPRRPYIYLDVGDVLDLYAQIFRCSVDQAADQLRDLAGLEGALARPATHAHYEDADVAMQAAILAHGSLKASILSRETSRPHSPRCAHSSSSMGSS